MYTKEIRKAKSLRHQYFTFRMVNIITGLAVWSFYSILLYKATGSIVTVLLDGLIFYIAVWIGYVIGAFTLDSKGYLKSFRNSSIVEALAVILVLVFIDNIGSLFFLFAIVRGIGRGLFWPVDHTFNVKEIHGYERGRLINLIESIDLILRIILPILVGSLLVYTQDYRYLFLLGFLIYLISILLPWEYNKKTQSKIRVVEFTRILQSRDFETFALINFVFYGSMTVFQVTFLVVPFILIGDELGVGALLSFAGIAAAIGSFLERNMNIKLKTQFGVFGFLVFSILNILLGIIWTIPILTIRSIGETFTKAVGFTAQRDMDFRIREKLLGEFRDESAIEMNIIVETTILIGRIISFSLMLLVVTAFDPKSSEDVLRTIIASASLFSFFGYCGFYVLNRRLKIR